MNIGVYDRVYQRISTLLSDRTKRDRSTGQLSTVREIEKWYAPAIFAVLEYQAGIH